MSCIHLFFNPLDARSCQTFEVPNGTPLIEWLQENYPDGFNGMLQVFIGNKELDLIDLDTPAGDEQVIMLVMPGEATFWTMVGKALIQVVIAAAIGAVIGFLFAPETPGAFGGGDESPVYTLNPTRNEARLGQPISCHYGTVSWPPDYASAPYVFFSESSNDMYVDELLCLGQGEFIIDEIFVGDTPVTTLEAGSVKWWQYGPDEHQQSIGTIEANLATILNDDETPIFFRENVFTSPEVEGWEFNDDVSAQIATTAISGSAFAERYQPTAGNFKQGRIKGISDTLEIREGDEVTLAGTTSNNITFIVGSATDQGDGTQTIFQSWNDAQKLVDEDPLNAAATLATTAQVSNMKAGPFRAQKLGQTVNAIDCDIIFPQGLYRVDGTSGTIKDADKHSVDLTFTYQRIDESTGLAAGTPVTQTVTFNDKITTAKRVTVASGTLFEGPYEVTVQRDTPTTDDTRVVNTVQWTGLKGHIVDDPNKLAYGPVTLVAIRLKATNGLGQAARQRVRVKATRVLEGGSNNPVVAIKDIWNNADYGMGRSLDELDPVIDAYESEWATTGPYFNGTFDQRGTGFEGMQRIASLAAARVVQNGAYTTIVPDVQQPTRKAMFSTANIIEHSFAMQYTFDSEGEFDGIEVEYRDPDTFDVAYTVYPRESVAPENFVLFGCTDPTYAYQYATYLWNVKTKRRKIATINTELDGLLPRFGDRIAISHNMLDMGQSGVFVKQISTNVWQVDQALDWEKDNVIILRDERGVPTDKISVTQGAHPQYVVFSGTLPLDPSDGYAREPTSYAFGRTYNVVKDFIVSRIAPKGDNIVEVEGQVYDDDIYVGGPPHMRT